MKQAPGQTDEEKLVLATTPPVEVTSALDAISRGDGKTLSRYFLGNFPPDPRVTRALADMLDPDRPANFLNEYRLEFVRRARGRPSNATAGRRAMIAAAVAEKHKKMLDDGEPARGLRKRVIGIIADEWECDERTVRNALKIGK